MRGLLLENSDILKTSIPQILILSRFWPSSSSKAVITPYFGTCREFIKDDCLSLNQEIMWSDLVLESRDAVDMIQWLVSDTSDGAHHPSLPPATLHTPHITVHAASTRLQVNLLIFIWDKTSIFPPGNYIKYSPKKVLHIYSEIWFPDFDSEKWLSSLLSIRLNWE